MQTKKEKSPILVVSTIIFLAIFIILPPLFRAIYPNNTSAEDITTNPIRLLTCTKTTTDGYTVTSKVQYTNKNPARNIIVYNKLQDIANQENTTTPSNIIARTATEEISFFKSISGLTVIEGENTTTVTIKKEDITNNSDNLELANYLLSEKKQQEYYEGQQYTCSINDI